MFKNMPTYLGSFASNMIGINSDLFYICSNSNSLRQRCKK